MRRVKTDKVYNLFLVRYWQSMLLDKVFCHLIHVLWVVESQTVAVSQSICESKLGRLTR